MSELALYFHTIRHLRPIQIAARVWSRVHRPAADLRAPPPVRLAGGRYAAPIVRPQTVFGPGTFRFLNVERRCEAAADWQPQDVPKLWRYHLHYFDDLNAHASPARTHWHRQLLERWVGENPPGSTDGWEPYPLSRRVVNWIKWAACGNVLPAVCQASLAVQVRWLCARFEYHILGNHLLANAKALLYAGLYFEGAEAERWYRRAMGIIDRQLRDQVLPDGGHFELSTMYHVAVLEDLLDLINVVRSYGRPPGQDWYATVARMRRWLQVMSHPDGDIAFFNDAAFGVAATPAEIEAYANRLELGPSAPPDVPLAVLADSGYVRAAAGDAYLICDCAAVGPSYLPGHAHADTLSFELSLAGQRVLVNSGVSEYGNRAERQRQRGTAAHNTVVIDGQDSSEVWNGFRVARRAHARLSCAMRPDPGLDATATAIIEGTHDGYARLPGRNRHTRRWILGQQSLSIEDRVSGRFERAEARFHLHPSIDARFGARNEIGLSAGGRQMATVVFEGAASVRVSRGTWHPGFGVVADNHCIIASLSDSPLTTHMSWPQLR